MTACAYEPFLVWVVIEAVYFWPDSSENPASGQMMILRDVGAGCVHWGFGCDLTSEYPD